MWYFRSLTMSPPWATWLGNVTDITYTWTITGTFAVIFADGSALVTKPAKPSTMHHTFEVSLGDWIVPEYPLGMEKVWLNGTVNATTERVRALPSGRQPHP
jgi:hypothetical protein